jgi:hypothetical protein
VESTREREGRGSRGTKVKEEDEGGGDEEDFLHGEITEATKRTRSANTIIRSQLKL